MNQDVTVYLPRHPGFTTLPGDTPIRYWIVRYHGYPKIGFLSQAKDLGVEYMEVLTTYGKRGTRVSETLCGSSSRFSDLSTHGRLLCYGN